MWTCCRPVMCGCDVRSRVCSHPYRYACSRALAGATLLSERGCIASGSRVSGPLDCDLDDQQSLKSIVEACNFGVVDSELVTQQRHRCTELCSRHSTSQLTHSTMCINGLHQDVWNAGHRPAANCLLFLRTDTTASSGPIVYVMRYRRRLSITPSTLLSSHQRTYVQLEAIEKALSAVARRLWFLVALLLRVPGRRVPRSAHPGQNMYMPVRQARDEQGINVCTPCSTLPHWPEL